MPIGKLVLPSLWIFFHFRRSGVALRVTRGLSNQTF